MIKRDVRHLSVVYEYGLDPGKDDTRPNTASPSPQERRDETKRDGGSLGRRRRCCSQTASETLPPKGPCSRRGRVDAADSRISRDG